jgi:hypothetical protein
MSISELSKTSVAAISFSLVTLCIVACGSPADPQNDQIEAQSQPIIGGTPTFARPEVGQVSIGGAGCTATLISPDTFVTAAHCINYAAMVRGSQYRYWDPDGATLFLYDGNGVKYKFPWDKLVTQGFKGDFSDDSVGQDWAVGHLINPVPSTLATPAKISTFSTNDALPWQWYTDIGFGCNGNQTGFNVKRYFEWMNYSWTGCEGDSGGPKFYGKLVQNGEMCGALSCVTNGINRYADVVKYRTHIMSLIPALKDRGVCYRAYIHNVGWQPAVCNGVVAGNPGKAVAIDAVQIWSARPDISICYKAWVRGVGFIPWQGCDGESLGTVGPPYETRLGSMRGRPIEAIKLWVAKAPIPTSIYYQANVQNLGWGGEFSNNLVAGTTNKNLLLEAFNIYFKVGKAVLISPYYEYVYTKTPTYTWNAEYYADMYILQVTDSTGKVTSDYYLPDQVGCASGYGTCSITPTRVLATGVANWSIWTYNNNTGFGPMPPDSVSFWVVN